MENTLIFIREASIIIKESCRRSERELCRLLKTPFTLNNNDINEEYNITSMIFDNSILNKLFSKLYFIYSNVKGHFLNLNSNCLKNNNNLKQSLVKLFEASNKTFNEYLIDTYLNRCNINKSNYDNYDLSFNDFINLLQLKWFIKLKIRESIGFDNIELEKHNSNSDISNNSNNNAKLTGIIAKVNVLYDDYIIKYKNGLKEEEKVITIDLLDPEIANKSRISELKRNSLIENNNNNINSNNNNDDNLFKLNYEKEYQLNSRLFYNKNSNINSLNNKTNSRINSITKLTNFASTIKSFKNNRFNCDSNEHSNVDINLESKDFVICIVENNLFLMQLLINQVGKYNTNNNIQFDYLIQAINNLKCNNNSYNKNYKDTIMNEGINIDDFSLLLKSLDVYMNNTDFINVYEYIRSHSKDIINDNSLNCSLNHLDFEILTNIKQIKIASFNLNSNKTIINNYNSNANPNISQSNYLYKPKSYEEIISNWVFTKQGIETNEEVLVNLLIQIAEFEYLIESLKEDMIKSKDFDLEGLFNDIKEGSKFTYSNSLSNKDFFDKNDLLQYLNSKLMCFISDYECDILFKSIKIKARNNSPAYKVNNNDENSNSNTNDKPVISEFFNQKTYRLDYFEFMNFFEPYNRDNQIIFYNKIRKSYIRSNTSNTNNNNNNDNSMADSDRFSSIKNFLITFIHKELHLSKIKNSFYYNNKILLKNIFIKIIGSQEIQGNNKGKVIKSFMPYINSISAYEKIGSNNNINNFHNNKSKMSINSFYFNDLNILDDIKDKLLISSLSKERREYINYRDFIDSLFPLNIE